MGTCTTCEGKTNKKGDPATIKCSKCAGVDPEKHLEYVKKYRSTDKGKQKTYEVNLKSRMTNHPPKKCKKAAIVIEGTGGMVSPPLPHIPDSVYEEIMGMLNNLDV